jgi:hypothetical protein
LEETKVFSHKSWEILKIVLDKRNAGLVCFKYAPQVGLKSRSRRSFRPLSAMVHRKIIVFQGVDGFDSRR